MHSAWYNNSQFFFNFFFLKELQPTHFKSLPVAVFIFYSIEPSDSRGKYAKLTS